MAYVIAVALIQVQGLTKEFRTYKKLPGLAGALKGLFKREHERVLAVDNVSFQIEEGEFVGFLGPNGAGKTTTLKMLAGLLFPSGGTASVMGYVPWERDDGYRRQFALLLGQKNQLWWDLPARESLELNAKIYGIPADTFEKTVKEMTALLGVTDKLGVMVRELSLGERMKMELTAALLHQPRVLFLDEPTIGLDVVSQKAVRGFLREHNARHKTTIVLTSHYMADIQELCERVIIIDRGKLFYDGRLDAVLDKFADAKILTVHFGAGGGRMDYDFARFGTMLCREASEVKLKVRRDQVIPVCKTLFDEFPVTDLDIQEIPVEEVIAQIFTANRETPAAPVAPQD